MRVSPLFLVRARGGGSCPPASRRGADGRLYAAYNWFALCKRCLGIPFCRIRSCVGFSSSEELPCWSTRGRTSTQGDAVVDSRKMNIHIRQTHSWAPGCLDSLNNICLGVGCRYSTVGRLSTGRDIILCLFHCLPFGGCGEMSEWESHGSIRQCERFCGAGDCRTAQSYTRV